MTPPTAPDTATDRQTVGDILLARGYIKQDQLDQAIGSQQQSGKPLGQVLVEAGAITGSSSRARSPSSGRRPRRGSALRTNRKGATRGAREPSSTTTVALEAREAATRSNSRTRSSSSPGASQRSSPPLTDLKLRVESGRGRRARQADRPDRGRPGRTLPRSPDGSTSSRRESSGRSPRSRGRRRDLAGEIDALAARVDLAADRSSVDDIRSTLHEMAARPVTDPATGSAHRDAGEPARGGSTRRRPAARTPPRSTRCDPPSTSWPSGSRRAPTPPRTSTRRSSRASTGSRPRSTG